MSSIIEVFPFIVKSVVIFCFLNYHFSCKRGSVDAALFKAVCIFTAAFLHDLFDALWIDIAAVFILTVTVLSFCYYCRLKNVVITASVVSVIVFVIGAITEAFNGYGTGSVEKHGLTGLFIPDIFETIIFLILMWIYSEILIKSKRDRSYSSGGVFVFLPCMTAAVLLLYGIYAFGRIPENADWLVIMMFILLLFILGAFYIYYYVTVRANAELAAKLAENKRVQVEHDYYNLIEDKNRELIAFVHDEKNHLETIRQLAAGTPACDYIDEIYDNLKNYTIVSDTDNKMLDIILSKYISVCREKGIAFDHSVKTANLSFMTDNDLISLVSNILDNAVAAAEKAEEKKIYFSINKRNGRDVLSCSNTFADIRRDENGELLTDKNNRHGHGFGKKIITRTAEKYSGDVGYYTEDGFFVLNILFLS